jgi:PadR family transcriptional regulator, regulatory protein PadR
VTVLGPSGLTLLAEPATLRRQVMIRETAISQLRRGVLEFCVLALLRDGERYSFEIVSELSQADGLVTTEGTLYPLLSRLRKDGVVDTTWRESPSGPPRRYYSLTTAGSAALSAFASEWSQFRDSVDTLLEIGASS